MEPIVSTVRNPSWWILTVFVGLALNIFAPFINKWIESVLKSRSERKRAEAESEDYEVKVHVEELASKETGLIEAKLNAMYWAIRVILAFMVYLMLIQLFFAIPLVGNLLVAPLSLMAFFSITNFWKQWKYHTRIHNKLTKKVDPTSGKSVPE